MASIPVDEGLAARLAERAKRDGVTLQLVERAVEEYLDGSVELAPNPFAFIGIGSNPDVQAEDADQLLAKVSGLFGFQRGVMVASRSQLGRPA